MKWASRCVHSISVLCDETVTKPWLRNSDETVTDTSKGKVARSILDTSEAKNTFQDCFSAGKKSSFLFCSANQLIKNKRPDYVASFFCGDKIEITICVRWKILKGQSRILNRYRRGSSVYSTLTRLYLISVTSCAATILHSG
jgi:hypothetical protein